MSELALKVENLSKCYRLGEREPYRTLRESLARMFSAPFASRPNSSQAPAADTVWALREVSFEVHQGEVIGIIGRNGAGKSTLLKILAKITEPTSGRAEIRGRIGSLLEIGTGFHPELTGRENIFLYGAILGMSRAEIRRKFDEIVAFAELEKFMDTPVKRYSSGMYMRLAFAVAAHLETEILLIDEVLAVGDGQFQKKCLAKMGDVVQAGRTILFVSHNMQAIQSLCKSALHLNAGTITAMGDSRSIVSGYLASLSSMRSEKTWPPQSAPGNDEIRLLQIRVLDENGRDCNICPSSKDFYVEIRFLANTIYPALCVGFDLVTAEGTVVARSYQTDPAPEEWPQTQIGENRWQCRVPKGLLNAGLYYLSPKIGMHNLYWIVDLDAILQFEIILDHGVSPFWNVLNEKNRPGVIAPIFNWKEVR
ncbi:MAG: ABC transporter ATP-binding protein [Desulfobacteraceae bacterium]|nr:MAG: ABC transporter ATP-binding protein [Desulfobacteraceae bacterium]